MRGRGEHHGLPISPRGPVTGPRPSVSVVVASTAEESVLTRLLGSLLPQAAEQMAEVVVVRCRVGSDLQLLEAKHPRLRFVEAVEGSSTAELRVTGMNHARGDIVALIEDERIATSTWLTEVVGRLRISTEIPAPDDNG